MPSRLEFFSNVDQDPETRCGVDPFLWTPDSPEFRGGGGTLG